MLTSVNIANAFGSRAPGNNSDISLDLPETVNQAEETSWVDSVDPKTGNLEIRQKDFSISGQGLDIEVWRTYSMLSSSAALGATQNGSYRWADIGAGWSLDAAPKISVKNRYETAVSNHEGVYSYWGNYLLNLCSTTQTHAELSGTTKHRSGMPPVVLELPGGGRESFYSVGNHQALTKNNWKLECVSDQVKVTSPKGVIYDYGNVAARRIGVTYNNAPERYSELTEESPPTQSETYMLANSAKDLYGNVLTFSYQTFGTPIPLWPQPGISKTGPGFFWGPNPTGSADEEFYDLERNVTLLQRISSSDGRYVEFTRDASTGKLVRATASSGRTIDYSYLAHDQLNTRNLSKVSYNTGETWEYRYAPGTYLDSEQLIPLTEANVTARKLIGLTYPSGGTVSYSYTYQTDMAVVTLSNLQWPVYDSSEKVASRTLSTGESWKYSYARGTGTNYDTTLVEGPEGTTTYKYVGNSYNLTTALPGGYNESVWMTGLLMEKTDPLGNTERYSWTPRVLTSGRDFSIGLGYAMDSQIWAADLSEKRVIYNGLTYITSYSGYDQFGNAAKKTEQGPTGLIRETNYTYVNDQPTWQIGLESQQQTGAHQVVKEYDGKGAISSLSTDGVTVQFTYDGGGNLATKTTPRGYVYTYGDYKLGIARTESQPEGIQISRVVDDAGNIVSETNGNGETTAYTYDAMGRITSEKKPQGNVRTVAYTPLGRTAQRGGLTEAVEYSPFGQTAALTLGGIRTSYRYDGYGRKVFESDPGSESGTNYSYDAAGRLSKKTFADGSAESYEYVGNAKKVTDGRGNATTFEYMSYGEPTEQYLSRIIPPLEASITTITRNEMNLVTSITQGGFTRRYTYNPNFYLASVEGPEVGTVTFTRDLEGNLVSKRFGNITTSFTFDGLSRIVSVAYSSATDPINYTYDKTSRLLSAIRKDGDRSMSYDSNGNLISETLSTSGVTMNASYTYNGNDQLTSIKYPVTGNVVSYELDSLGRPVSIPGFINSVSYWPSGLTKDIVYANGVQSTYGQNSRLWPSSFRVENPSKTDVMLDSSYVYDANGNLNNITDSVDETLNRILSYDAINRLVAVEGYAQGGAIQYDGMGNILSQTHGGQTLAYTYDIKNRLSSLSGSSTSTFKYDSLGNLVSDGNNTYSYNATPNLVCINCDSPLAVKYRYDALNYRRLSVRAGEQTYEMYDSLGRLLASSVKGKPNVTTEYIYLGEKRVAQRVND
jgi:YD repeat-containing protein